MNIPPKIVWAFWDSQPIPELIELCIKSWQINLKDYSINILNYNNVFEYVDITNDIKDKLLKLNIANQADYFRLYLLYKYGGYWIDASTFVNRDFSFIEQKFIDDHELDIFYPIKKIDYGKTFYSWENSFIASPKNSKSIKIILDKYHGVLFENEPFVKFTIREKIKLIIPSNKYHLVYAIHNDVATNNEYFRKQAEKQTFSRANVAIYDVGSYVREVIIKHMYYYKYNNEPMKELLYNMPFFKIIKHQREALLRSKNYIHLFLQKKELY